MSKFVVLALAFGLTGCGQVTVTPKGSITSAELESFLRHHPVDGHEPVALKKRSLGVDSFLATIHGFPNNLEVCGELIAPYNTDPSKSVVSGTYFCEELR